ncbi:MAG TPA: PAS domain S-box protein, partial [Kofleriaceae bacterium]|nr:PAS domain S-box protein [Kofleriaceae bacterium]
MTERVAPAAEFDAIARIAAGMLDAPVATVTVFDERATRLGSCGVSWPVVDEEPLLRAIAGDAAGEAAPRVLDLAVGIAGAAALRADDMRGAVIVGLRDAGAVLGALAVYAPVVLEVSHLARRRLLDLAEIAAQLVIVHRRLALSTGDAAVDEPAPVPGHAERRILELVKQSGDRIAITDEQGKIVYVNPALARARNQTAAELIGRSVSELNPPELRHLPGYERIRRTGHDATISQPFVRQIDLGDGRRAAWEIGGTGFSVDGTPYVGVIARDLSAATQRLSATMESVSIAIAHVTLDGQFLRFNDHFEVLVGRSGQELRAYHHVLDVAPPPDQRGLPFIDALGLAGRVDMLAIRAHLVTADEPYEIEYQLVRP